MRAAPRPSHRFVFGPPTRDSASRIERQLPAIKRARFTHSSRLPWIWRRIAVNERVIRVARRTAICDLRGADVQRARITARALRRLAIGLPNLLTMAPVNPHL
ncbi:conserved hypothetical protein [Burkholderia vietnamiensis G4]|uniref:Uncharacterized protein n=1 Tax=Burkholderia vietnamiensis (strain G4 / LMG 22486) TaxID=269482 RepID=A4JK69_BURVG|nr:conserved hypothetical protein [Burkholderia vietnamiensis G4]